MMELGFDTFCYKKAKALGLQEGMAFGPWATLLGIGVQVGYRLECLHFNKHPALHFNCVNAS